MELFLIPIGIAVGLAAVFFFMWRRAETRLADAEALALDLYQTNEKIQESYDKLRGTYWKVLAERKDYDQGGEGEGALTDGEF